MPAGDRSLGEYQCTPDTPFIAFEGVEHVTPFVLHHSSQFRPGPPYALDKKQYTADYNEVKSLGSDELTSPRTAGATKPKSPSSGGKAPLVEMEPDCENRFRPPGDSISGRTRGSSACRTWHLRTATSPWSIPRIITTTGDRSPRIREGDTDGNPDTIGDPMWNSLCSTPPNQDYASGHAIEGGAGAEVLKQFFGTDEISFEDCGATLPAGQHLQRSDAGIPPVHQLLAGGGLTSRTPASSSGFTSANRSKRGTEYGRKIGHRAVNLYLRPVH